MKQKKLKNVISVVGESGKFTTLSSLKSFIEANNQKVTAHISPSIQDIKVLTEFISLEVAGNKDFGNKKILARFEQNRVNQIRCCSIY